MRFYTHLVAGLLVAVMLVEFIDFPHTIAAVLWVLFGSILPDIDEKHSRLGKLFPMIPKLFVHRGFFHSIFLATAITIALSLVVYQYALAFAAGFLTHLLLDAMTPAGVRPFWPSDLRVRGFVKTGGVLEAVLFMALVVLVVWMLVSVG